MASYMNAEIFTKCYREASQEYPLGSEQALHDETYRRYAKAICAVMQYEGIDLGRQGAADRLELRRYQFTPLKSAQEIRLLRFRGWVHCERERFLSYEIVQADLKQRPTYTALSYTWGSTEESNCELVILGGDKLLMVTKPLIHLLYQQTTNPDMLLWTDQLCINQWDLSERAAQVAIMGHIYSGAVSTILWLGPSDVDSRAVAEIMAKVLPMINKSGISDPTTAVKEILAPKGRKSTIDSTILDPEGTSQASIHAFLHRSWFSRLWVFQEAILSAKPMFQCGAHTFNLLALAILTCLDASRTVETSPGADMSTKIQLYRNKVGGKLPLFAHLVYDVGGLLHARDARDRIYALLGIQEVVQKLSINVDYTKSVVEVYVDTAREMITKAGDLHILQYVKGADQLRGLPSWVPNWSVPSTVAPLHGSYDENAAAVTPKFSAAKSLPHYFKTAESHTLLAVQGRIVDSTSRVFESLLGMPGEDFTFPMPSHIMLACGFSKDPSLAKKVIRTLTADGFDRSQADSLRSEEPFTYKPLSEEEILQFDNTLEKFREIRGGAGESSWESDRDELADVLERWIIHTKVCENRVVAKLSRYHLALCPRGTIEGDVVAILHGLDTPIVLRARHSSSTAEVWGQRVPVYSVIGPCFVDGIMYGEAVDWVAGKSTNIVLA